MKYIILAYLVAAAIGICVWKHVPHVEVAVPTGVNETLWRRGRLIHKVNCITCHNSNPDLPGSVGPALRGVSEELLTSRLKNGKNGMPAQPHMLRHIPALREYLK